MVRAAFGPQADNALKVFRCESGLNPRTVGDSSLPSTRAFHLLGLDYGESVGIGQIRLLPGRPGRDWLLVPANNIAYAHGLYAREGWGPWTCARNLGIN